MASPPSVPQLNIPRKRGSVSSLTSASKKRKPSSLRNAYSPDSDLPVGSPLRYSRSPSVDSVATGSMVNGAPGRKRKRRDGDAASTTGSQRGKPGSTAAGGAPNGEAEDEDYESSEEDEGEDIIADPTATQATRKQEAEYERMLVEAFSDPQKERYETYRRIRLKRDTVRKLVNQTLSQSVPQPVIIAVTSYSKAFIGDLIDRALTVRDEWCAARTHRPNPDMHPALLKTGLGKPSNYKPGAKPSLREVADAGLYNVMANQFNAQGQNVGGIEYLVEVAADEGLKERLRMEDKGPLTPGHLREALRRYKRDREGGGAGMAGMSLEGMERTMGRMGGRRLFR